MLFCFPSYGHSKRKKSHGKPRVPTVENDRLSGCDGLSVHLATVCAAAATFSGRAAGLHATRDIVAGKHDLEVVGDEGAHEAVGGANLVLRLVGLHHGEVSLRALGRLVRRAVLLPPRRGELRLLLEGGASLLLLGSVGIVMTVTVGTVGLARLFVHTVNYALSGA